MPTTKKQRIETLIDNNRKFRFCGPSDDPDEQTAVTTGYRHLVIQFKRLVGPILPKVLASRLNGIEVDINDLYSAFEAKAEIDALIPDIESALELLDRGDVAESDVSLPLRSRRQFESDLKAFASSASESAPLSLIFIDVDHFKAVNDSCGHAVGDEVLLGVASLMRSICDGKANCYRWAGDELTILARNYSDREGAALAERIRRAVSELKFARYANQVTVSIGVAEYCDTGVALEAFIEAADKAAYTSKQGGRNRTTLAQGNSTGTDLRAEGEKRPSPDEITSRVEGVRLWVRLSRGKADNFVVIVESKSSELVVIDEVRLQSGQIILSEPALPPTPDVWKIQPNGTLYVSWWCRTDPAAALIRMNDEKGLSFKTDLRIVLQCRILGRVREFEQMIPVSVNATQKEIVSLI